MKLPVRLLVVLMLALLAIAAPLLVIRAVRADVAPPPEAAASGIMPGQGTQVSMISETVVLDVRSEPLAESDYTQTIALVTADFLMRNLGSQTETMDVRFPMAWPASFDSTQGNMIQNVEVTVAGQHVMTKQVDFAGQPWTIWPATFPPGKDVRLKVKYRAAATEWNNSLLGYFSVLHLGDISSLADFYYILETGAGWRGPIGQGDIIFRFPTAASQEMIEPNDLYPAYTSTTPSFAVEGRDLRWHFTNLEPTSRDNVNLSVITPPVWRAILDARRQAQLKPKDASAQIQLGEAYWAAIPVKNFWPKGMSLADHFGPLAEAAFKRAVELAPDSVLAHLSDARFLTYHAWGETPEPYYSRALQEVNQVLEKDPTNAEAKDLAAFLHNTIYPYWVVTPTPTSGPLWPTSIPAATRIPQLAASTPTVRYAANMPAPLSPTPQALLNPSPTPASDSISTGNLTVLIGLIVVAVVIVVYVRLRK